MNKKKDRPSQSFIRQREQDAIENPITIEQPKNWLIWFILLILGILLVTWAFFGKIPSEISGNAVSFSTSGTLLIQSKAAGVVAKLYVNEGEIIKKNDPLVRLDIPELHSLLSQISGSDQKIRKLRSELELLKQALETQERLWKEGLIAKLIIDQSKAKIYDKEIELENAFAEQARLIADLENVSPASKEEITKAKSLIKKDPTQINTIEEALSIFKAPSSGTILEIHVNEGSLVNRKDPLVWMEYPPIGKDGTIFLATIGADNIGRVEEGMRVLIEPFTVNPQEYGALIGHVREIYGYPVSKEELTQEIGNEQIVNFLIGSKPVATFMLIEPVSNPETASGFKWTSREGPPFNLQTGTLAQMKLVIDEQPPISYLIPLWRIKDAVGLTQEKKP